VAQHHPTGSETTPPYAPRNRRFGSEPPSVEDDVDIWRYAIVSCMPETTTTSGISEAKTTNKRLRSTFYIEAIQTRSIARPLCDSRPSCYIELTKMGK